MKIKVLKRQNNMSASNFLTLRFFKSLSMEKKSQRQQTLKIKMKTRKERKTNDSE